MTLCETVPYLLTAISPEIRPVSANFLKPEEARLMRNSVSTMVSHALTYAAPPEGGIPFGAFRGAQVSMVLDPPVDRVVNFGSDVAGYVLPGTGAQRWQKGYKKDAQFEQGAGGEKTFGGVTRRVLPAAVKSMLQHEVRMEEIRRAECAVHGPGTPPAKREQKPQLKQGGVGGSEEHKEAAAKRLAMAMGGIGQKKESRNDRSKRLKQEEGGMPTVVYKYNEGFTNAVRKKVYMRDLF
jgi:chromosome transmission fidelity protein 18